MNDLEFVQRCIKGDKQSWNVFVDKYSRLIYTYIYSVLKVKGALLAEDDINDLFQEIFLALAKDNFQKLRTFKAKNGCSLATWLRQVTVNFTIDYIRKLKPIVSLDEENEDELALKDIFADDAPAIRDTITYEEKLQGLKDCIKALDNNDRYFLELHINRSLTLEELKSHFRVSRGAIDMRKNRIIERLRDCFKRKGFMLDL